MLLYYLSLHFCNVTLLTKLLAHLHVKLCQVWLEFDARPVVAGLAGSDLGLALGAHVVGEGLQEAALALAVACLHNELCAEDVGQLGTIAVAATSDLHPGKHILSQRAYSYELQLLD
jgi:hypothetical protein